MHIYYCDELNICNRVISNIFRVKYVFTTVINLALETVLYQMSTKIGYSVNMKLLSVLIYNIITLVLQFHWELKFIAFHYKE